MQDPKSKEEQATPVPERAAEPRDADGREAKGARHFSLIGDQWKPRTPKAPPAD